MAEEEPAPLPKKLRITLKETTVTRKKSKKKMSSSKSAILWTWIVTCKTEDTNQNKTNTHAVMGYTSRGGGKFPGTFKASAKLANSFTFGIPNPNDQGFARGDVQSFHLSFYPWRISTKEHVEMLKKWFSFPEDSDMSGIVHITNVLEKFDTTRQEESKARILESVKSNAVTVANLTSALGVPVVGPIVAGVFDWIPKFTALIKDIQGASAKPAACLGEFHWVFNAKRKPRGVLDWSMAEVPLCGFWRQDDPGSGSIGYLLAERSPLQLTMNSDEDDDFYVGLDVELKIVEYH